MNLLKIVTGALAMMSPLAEGRHSENINVSEGTVILKTPRLTAYVAHDHSDKFQKMGALEDYVAKHGGARKCGASGLNHG